MGNIVGLDLNIDQDYLANAVQQTVCMGISEALNGKNEITSQIVKSVLGTKVDKNGRISNYANDNKFTLLEYYVKEMLTDVAKEELRNLVNEKRDEVSAIIRKELSKKATTETFVNAFIKGVGSSLESSWRSIIAVDIYAKGDD